MDGVSWFNNPPISHLGLIGGNIARLSRMIAAALRLFILTITSVDVIG
jgi:hypothetical protein